MTHNNNSREVIIDVIGRSRAEASGRIADRVLAADPLRKLLGTRAIEAIMAGEAAVVPMRMSSFDEIAPGMVYADTGKGFGVQVLRLDTPDTSGDAS